MDENKRRQFIEQAIKCPEGIAETDEERLLRLTSEQLYYNSGGRRMSGIGAYEAGWKAAKAHYEVKQ